MIASKLTIRSTLRFWSINSKNITLHITVEHFLFKIVAINAKQNNVDETLYKMDGYRIQSILINR